MYQFALITHKLSLCVWAHFKWIVGRNKSTVFAEYAEQIDVVLSRI